MILKRLWFFILALLFCYKTLNLNSVAEPEPVAAGRSGTFGRIRSGVKLWRQKHVFYYFLAYFYMKRSRSRWKKSTWSRSKKDRLNNTESELTLFLQCCSTWPTKITKFISMFKITHFFSLLHGWHLPCQRPDPLEDQGQHCQGQSHVRVRCGAWASDSPYSPEDGGSRHPKLCQAVRRHLPG